MSSVCRFVTSLVLGAVVLVVADADSARADKCTAAKLKATGNKEASLLNCQAKVAAKNDPSGLPACESKVKSRFSTAFGKAGSCVGDETACENIADTCESIVSTALTDTFPSKCEASKRKAAGNLAKAELGCYSKAAAKGLAVDAVKCIPKAQAKFSSALTKAGACPDGGSPQSVVEANCVQPALTADGGGMVTDVCPITTTTTTTSTTTTTTLMSGCFTDAGDGTIDDTCTGLQWEKKASTAGLHGVNNLYAWAGLCGCATGSCTGNEPLCQPNAAAATSCTSSSGGTTGCNTCTSGTCNVDPNGVGTITTVWDWVNQVNGAGFAGHTDWRLAAETGCNACFSNGSCASCSGHELETILLAPYPCGTTPCIDSFFGPTAPGGYWSGSPITLNPANPWFVDFGNGSVNGNAMFHAYYVRAVRSGAGPTTTTTSTSPTTTASSSSTSTSSTTTTQPTTTSSTTTSSTSTTSTSTTTSTTTPLPCGTFLAEWGSMGGGNGQFNAPFGVAVDAGGNVYVGDGSPTSNPRIQKFDNAGTFLAKWGSFGSGDGQFGVDGPLGIAVDGSANVFVVDASNDRIQKFDGNGNFLNKWGSPGTGDGQFIIPLGVAVDESGSVYVTEYLSFPVQKFDNAGMFLAKWGGSGTGNGQFASPGSIAVDGSGNVFVADTGNNRIQKLDNTGTFLTTWGTMGSGNGQFNSPDYVAADASGNVFVADTGNNRVQVFDNTGTFLTKWGSVGSGNGQFGHPEGIAVDANGNVFVADNFNNRIQKFACSSGTP